MTKGLFEALKQSRALVPRLICGAVWSLKNTSKHRSPILVYRRRDDSYVNKRPDLVLVSPEVNACSLAEIESRVNDEWLWRASIEHGYTIVDVGAGIGDEIVVFSRATGAAGRVIAIEAHPATSECLNETVAANGLTNVSIVNMAVSDRLGTVSMQSGNSYLTGKIVEQGSGDVCVECLTIPSLLDLHGVDQVDFLKMNIEGAELVALRGCVGSFHRIRRMVVSCHDFIADANPAEDSMRTYEDVISLLSTNGYRLEHRRDDHRPWVRYYVYAERE